MVRCRVCAVTIGLMLAAVRAEAQSVDDTRALSPFRSDRELTRYLRPLVDEYQRREKARREKARQEKARRELAHQQAAIPQCKSVPTATRLFVAGGATEIAGHVRAADGPNIGGALVRSPELGLDVATDDSGAFRLTIPADSLTSARSVTVRALRIGYTVQTFRTVVGAGESITVEFRMCPVTVMLESVVTTGAAVSLSRSITNTQHEGIDEGDIVKLRGRHLIVLRRGRLFTVAIDDARVRPVAVVNAMGPDIDGKYDWYDEILTFEDKVIVVGYSYERGGTEIGVFHIDDAGGLRYLATYHLRSNDYYSSRNYASRLIDNKLVFYTPLRVPFDQDPTVALPAMRRWDSRAGGGTFRRIAAVQHIYRPPRPIAIDEELTMHTITTCDLRAVDLTCDASVVLGPRGRVFYASPSAVYVWTTPRRRRAQPGESIVYRLPFDGTTPTALTASGSPVDQFSFLESDDRHLNVVVRADAAGDGMWASGRSAGSVALLRVSIDDFGDGTQSAPGHDYRSLPSPPESTYTFENRFVGDHLLYGFGNGWGHAEDLSATLYVVPFRGGRITKVSLGHAVDRIDAMGRDAIVVGADTADLHFSGIRLDRTPHVQQQFTLRSASQGELRSHSFFYRPDDSRSGVVGLPVRRPGRPGYEHLFTESASVIFLRNSGHAFEPLGELAANTTRAVDDKCEVSCVDWYGNSRPIFIGRRIFALLGYELVEGVARGNALAEVRRVDFAPRRKRVGGR